MKYKKHQILRGGIPRQKLCIIIFIIIVTFIQFYLFTKVRNSFSISGIFEKNQSTIINNSRQNKNFEDASSFLKLAERFQFQFLGQNITPSFEQKVQGIVARQKCINDIQREIIRAHQPIIMTNKLNEQFFQNADPNFNRRKLQSKKYREQKFSFLQNISNESQKNEQIQQNSTMKFLHSCKQNSVKSQQCPNYQKFEQEDKQYNQKLGMGINFQYQNYGNFSQKQYLSQKFLSRNMQQPQLDYNNFSQKQYFKQNIQHRKKLLQQFDDENYLYQYEGGDLSLNNFQFPRKISLIGVNTQNDNLEDQMLTAATLELINFFGISPQIPFCSFQKQQNIQNFENKQQQELFQNCNFEQIGVELGEGGLILIQGGGNWGDLYPSIHDPRFQYLDDEIKQMCNEFEDLLVVQLGQSVFYGDEYKWRYEMAAINSIRNCFIFVARSKDSEAKIREIYNKLEVIFSPDLGFMLKPITPIQKPLYDVYFLFRTDLESVLFHSPSNAASSSSYNEQEILQVIKNMADQNYFSFGLDFFWQYTKNSEEEYRENMQEEFFRIRYQALSQQISLGKVLVTDRVHASIAAILMGIPNVWIDTKYKQLSGVLYSAFGVSENCDGRLLHSYQAQDLETAIKIAIKLSHS